METELFLPFYDVLGQKYPPLENNSQLSNRSQAYPSSVDHLLPYALASNLVITPALEFNKGVEEGIKFLPNIDKLVMDFEAKKLCCGMQGR